MLYREYICFTNQALFQEKLRMHSVMNSIALRELNISGSSAMAAAFVTFLGPYDVTFRRMMMTDHWPRCLVERGIPLTFDTVHPVYGKHIYWLGAVLAANNDFPCALSDCSVNFVDSLCRLQR